MKCDVARDLVLERVRGRLAEGDAATLDAHLAECASCRRAAEVERVTDELLARRPVQRVPAALAARIRARIAPKPRPRAPWAFVIAAALAVALILVLVRDRSEDRRALEARLLDESVNDHLRVLYAEHPLDIASGGIHQVKPWFAGKLDFAPGNVFEGDDDFPLQGGAVAVMLDRKAAAFVYKRRLHVITLLVTRAAGLPWPAATEQAGRVRVHTDSVRGFNTVSWVDGELGYALVSDVDRAELVTLAAKVSR
jgi:anti-sigma factor RsiW